MFDRKIDYLRISVTDRCNLRCIYCMPRTGIEPVSHQDILTFEEIIRLVNIFASLGIKKIRLTGGEPLVRKDIITLVKSIAAIKEIEEIALTTNGIFLSERALELKKAGLGRINISLDTLREERFKYISYSDGLYKVIDGIDKARELGFSPLKLNMVVMKDVNDDEIYDFIDFSLSKGLILRFIEFMKITPLWKDDGFILIEEVKEICAKRFKLDKIKYRSPGPAEYYKTAGGSILGFIKTNIYNCGHCNRLRLTSTGELRLCLYEEGGISLRSLLRKGATDQEIRGAISARMDAKEFIDYKKWDCGKVYMSSIGG